MSSPPGRVRSPLLGASLGAERADLLQKRVGFGERGSRPHPLEDLAGLVQDGCGLAVSRETEESPALAEECECLLGRDPETSPALSGVGVDIDGGLQSPRISTRAAFAASRRCLRAVPRRILACSYSAARVRQLAPALIFAWASSILRPWRSTHP
jgi:hypothetical protein